MRQRAPYGSRLTIASRGRLTERTPLPCWCQRYEQEPVISIWGRFHGHDDNHLP